LTPTEKTNVGGTPSPVGYGLARLGHSVVHVEILGCSAT